MGKWSSVSSRTGPSAGVGPVRLTRKEAVTLGVDRPTVLVVSISMPEEILKSDVYRGHIVSPVFSSGAGSVGDGYSEKGRLVGVGSVGATSQFTARHGNTW